MTNATLTFLKERLEDINNGKEDELTELKFDDQYETLVYFYEKKNTLLAVVKNKNTNFVTVILSTQVDNDFTTYDHRLVFFSDNIHDVWSWALEQLQELFAMNKDFENSNKDFKSYLLYKEPAVLFVLRDSSSDLRSLIDIVISRIEHTK